MQKTLLVGYGTLIYKAYHYKGIKKLGICIVNNYVRIFHEKICTWYPFVLPKKGHKFKGLLLEIFNEYTLAEIDRYEGVPDLYTREKCVVNFNGKLLTAWIYVPTTEKQKELKNNINMVIETERKKIFQEDLWLKYLARNYPQLKKEFPELFQPIKIQ
ncbi:MAG: gamma-glutamylcyclotransferase family protein [Candidatus Helarchaeota archaeon]